MATRPIGFALGICLDTRYLLKNFSEVSGIPEIPGVVTLEALIGTFLKPVTSVTGFLLSILATLWKKHVSLEYSTLLISSLLN